jgi:hypothetical protein
MSEIGTELVTFVPDNPVAVLTNAEQFDALLGRIREEVAAHKPDLTTRKGRDAIKSLAYKVTRTKTALDDAGKELNAAKRAEIDAVDAVRREVRAKLDDLAAQARKPLDEWESAEDERRIKIEGTMNAINGSANFTDGLTSDEIQGRIDSLTAMEFDADVFQDALEIAVNAKASALTELQAVLARQLQSEADAAELAALRQREAERIEAEHIAAEKAAAEQAERDAEEKRRAEILAAEKRAADAAKAESDRIANEAIAKANAEAEALRQAEISRRREAERIASETAAREADKKHRSATMKAAKEAMMEHGGVSEDAAKKIVLAIVADEIPNVRIVF